MKQHFCSVPFVLRYRHALRKLEQSLPTVSHALMMVCRSSKIMQIEKPSVFWVFCWDVCEHDFGSVHAHGFEPAGGHTECHILNRLIVLAPIFRIQMLCKYKYSVSNEIKKGEKHPGEKSLNKFSLFPSWFYFWSASKIIQDKWQDWK